MPSTSTSQRFALVAVLVLAGCVACSKKDAPEGTDGAGSAPAATPSPAAPEVAPAASGGSGEGQANTKYLCSSNIVLAVSYASNVAKFTYKDKPLELKAEAAEPTRYIGAG